MGSPVLGDRIGFCGIRPGYPGKESRPFSACYLYYLIVRL